MGKVPQKWMVVFAVLLGAFTLILNNSMLNPALPYFQEKFSADPVTVGWIITIFMVTMGMTMPVTGYLSDKFGKKAIFITGLSLFVAASLGGSLSFSLGSIIFFRGLQGVAGGIMMPLAMALIFEVFPPNERGRAMGIWGIAAMMAPTIGPTLGGFIIEKASWPYLFLANVPSGLLGLFISVKYLKSTTRNPRRKFDFKGFATVTLGVGAILVALGQMQSVSHFTDPLHLFLLGFGILSLLLFGWIEKRAKEPLLNLSLFRKPVYSLSVWISSIGTIGLFTSIFLLPYLIQHVYGYNAIVTGLVLLPSAAFTGIFMNIGGRILDKKGPMPVVPVGLFISSVMMFLLFTIDRYTPLWVIVLLMMLRGTGMGLTNMPATTTGMNAIPEEMVAQGSAMNNVLRRMSSAMGVVFVSIFYQVRKGQLTAAGMQEKMAALETINEAFLCIGLLTLITVPAGLLLGKLARQPQKSKKGAEAS